MLRVALGNIFVERYAEKQGEPCGNERSKVAHLVATLGRGNDAPVATRERMAENLTDELCDVGSEKLHHIGVALNVGQSPTIERFFPERYDFANQRDGSFGLLVCFCCNKQVMCQRI